MNNESKETEEKKVIEFQTDQKGVYSFSDEPYNIRTSTMITGIRG